MKIDTMNGINNINGPKSNESMNTRITESKMKNNSVWRRAQELWVQNCSIGHGQDGLFFASNRTVVQYNILYQVPCWDRCLRQRRFQVRLPVVWESSGSRLGAVWEPSGSRLGVVWESSGRRLGDVGRRRKMAPKIHPKVPNSTDS